MEGNLCSKTPARGTGYFSNIVYPILQTPSHKDSFLCNKYNPFLQAPLPQKHSSEIPQAASI